MKLVLVVAASAVLVAACSGGSSLTPSEAARQLEQAGYVCESPSVSEDSLGCSRPNGEAGYWTMSFVGDGMESGSLSDYAQNQWSCATDNQDLPIVFGGNWIVADGGGTENAYLVNDLGGTEGKLSDVCGAG